MEQPQAAEIQFLSFARLCLKEAFRTSTDKADWIVLIVGAALGPVAFFVPRWERQVTHLLLVAPISALSSVIIFRIFLSPLLVYRKRETDARNAENTLRTTLAEREKAILKLTTKPQRTPAEQHHYDTAKKTIDQLGPSCVIALRHLKTHGRLAFGFYSLELPVGIQRDDLLRLYNACLGAGLVTARDNPSHGERTFEIAPTMNAVLDELLYENGGSTSG
jgi:hypothetical protein